MHQELTLPERRSLEALKYERAYKDPAYGMKDWRNSNFTLYLLSRDPTHKKWLNFIDVGCGRGEAVALARRHGMASLGVEVVPYLCDHKHILHIEGAHDLSLFEDKAFDLVSSQDVMEHILEEDVPLVLAEMWRITRKTMFFTISSHPKSISHAGDVLHITVKPKTWWMEAISQATGMKPVDFSATMPTADARLLSYIEVER